MTGHLFQKTQGFGARAMGTQHQVDAAAVVLRQRLAAFTSQLSELENLRERVLEAEQIAGPFKREQKTGGATWPGQSAAGAADPLTELSVPQAKS
jgi:hypothetical protein